MKKRQIIEKIKHSINIEYLLSLLGFDNINVNSKRCNCIIHGGNNQSSFMWDDKNMFYCFTCGASGDVISLVQQVKKCDFQEALKYLSNLTGIEIDDKKYKTKDIDKRVFPVEYCRYLARKAENDYYKSEIDRINFEINELTDILIDTKNDNVPEFRRQIKYDLLKLDSDLIWFGQEAKK